MPKENIIQRKTITSLLNEQTIMEIKLIAVSPITTQGRFQARERFAVDA